MKLMMKSHLKKPRILSKMSIMNFLRKSQGKILTIIILRKKFKKDPKNRS